MKAIQTQQISKCYQNGSIKALDSLCLNVEKGRFLGLIGPNGAGKTTLIYIIAGLVRRTSGKLIVFGEEVNDEYFQYRRHIGFVLDRPMYLQKLTVTEYLEFVAEMYDIPKQEAEKKIKELIEFFDLTAVADTYIETYSKGMKQKVSLAAAIIHEPELLILDEPFNGIDAPAAEDIKQILSSMNQKGVTIILTSHILEWIESLCTDCAIMHKGKIVFQSSLDELETQLQNPNNDKIKASLRDIFLQITSSDRPHKSLSWLS